MSKFPAFGSTIYPAHFLALQAAFLSAQQTTFCTTHCKALSATDSPTFISANPTAFSEPHYTALFSAFHAAHYATDGQSLNSAHAGADFAAVQATVSTTVNAALLFSFESAFVAAIITANNAPL